MSAGNPLKGLLRGNAQVERLNEGVGPEGPARTGASAQQFVEFFFVGLAAKGIRVGEQLQ